MAATQKPDASPPTSAVAPPPPPPTSNTSSSPSPSLPAPTEQAQRYLENDPARTGFDPETKWWMNYFRILTGQMTPEGMHHYREWRYRVHEERDCAACERNRDYLLKYSPIIRFLSGKIEALNGRLDENNILCRRCPARVTEDGRVARQGAGFHPDFGILVCANEMRDRRHLEDNLAHEMVHAWDHLRWKVDWDKSLRHAACTEIRASMLSGECRWGREALTRGNWTLTEQFQRCVRMRAIQSVMARPRCRDDVHATKVVNEVWDSCFADTRPFDEVFK